MDTKTLFCYISDQVIDSSALATIKNGLVDMEAAAWSKGYTQALRHIRRRREAQRARRDIAVKRFLDYISDITYGGKVEEKKN